MTLSEHHALPYRLTTVVRRYGRVLMAGLILAVMVYAIVESLNFTEEARRMPLVVAVPAAVASFVLMVKELVAPAKLPDDDGETATSTAGAVTWVLALIAMFLLLGLLVTIPLFTVIFMRVYGRERWRTTLLAAAFVFGTVYVFFVQILGVQVFSGWASSWLDVL